MAKARAICRCKTCGCEFEKTTVKNNRAEADSWEAWAKDNFDECPDCYKKRIKEEESRKVATMTAEAGLPDLIGTEKQIGWAERIRIGFIETWDPCIEAQKNKNMVAVMDDFKTWMLSHEDCRFWIDNRYTFESGAKIILKHFKKDFYAHRQEAKEETTTTVEPVQKAHEMVYSVEYTSDSVKVSSGYNPDMIELLKSNRFKWNRQTLTWERPVGVMTGSATDRAAEIANKLLCSGYPVKLDKSIADAAISGSYEPEHERWIFIRDGLLKVYGDLDPVGIPGAKGRNIPVESWESIEEFAKLHDFRFSPGAREVIDAYKAKIRKVNPVAGREADYHDTADTVKDILNSSRDVLEDLREEE